MADTDNVKDKSQKVLNNEKKKKRNPRKDRTNGKYSEEDFRKLGRDMQLKLAEKYWNGPSDRFDDGTFKFSSAHFAKICASLGFEKRTVIVDKLAEKDDPADKDTIILISHGRRETERHNWSFSKGTTEKINTLLGDDITNTEKSKLIDEILNSRLDELLEKKKSGHLYWDYNRKTTKKKL